MLKLRGNIFMTLDCSWSRPKSHPYWGDVTMRIVGTDGTLYFSAFDSKVEVYSNNDGIKWENYSDDFDYCMIKEFLDCVKQRRTPLTSAKDGLESLKVALSAYKSLKNGSIPTKI